jgi:hypothetical protein
MILHPYYIETLFTSLQRGSVSHFSINDANGEFPYYTPTAKTLDTH